MKLKFISLASGSSGNCFYLGTTSYGILIDAGIGIRTIKKVLRERGIALESILGIFVTHDHADHIRAVGNLSEGCNIPVFTTETIHKGMTKSYCMTKKVSPVNRRIIQKEETTILRDFSITPFEIPHDGTDNEDTASNAERQTSASSPTSDTSPTRSSTTWPKPTT